MAKHERRTMTATERIVRETLALDGFPTRQLTVDNPAFVRFCEAVGSGYATNNEKAMWATFASAYSAAKQTDAYEELVRNYDDAAG